MKAGIAVEIVQYPNGYKVAASVPKNFAALLSKSTCSERVPKNTRGPHEPTRKCLITSSDAFYIC